MKDLTRTTKNILGLSNNTYERILAIDFGEKRIGLAISDPFKIFSIPLKTLSNNKNFWEHIKQIIIENNVFKIVLGYPLNENGTKSFITQKVEKFKDELEKKTKLAVTLYDERYSSEIAQNVIISTIKSKKKRQDKSLLDMRAAAVILQDYLNENKEN